MNFPSDHRVSLWGASMQYWSVQMVAVIDERALLLEKENSSGREVDQSEPDDEGYEARRRIEPAWRDTEIGRSKRAYERGVLPVDVQDSKTHADTGGEQHEPRGRATGELSLCVVNNGDGKDKRKQQSRNQHGIGGAVTAPHWPRGVR